MKRQALLILLIVISLAGFSIYCYAWIDWVQDLSGGVYTTNIWEGSYETTALLIYTAAALRFMARRFIK